MKAVAVLPGKPNSVHLRDLPVPKLSDQPHPHVCRVPEGRGVLVKVLQVGVDATDREINEALYGNAPPGGDHLVIGHESFGQVLEVGDKVTEVRPGDFVSCTVRRPGRVAVRPDRPQRYHQRRGLLRARHQSVPWLPDRGLCR